jgi:hypothetical protein
LDQTFFTFEGTEALASIGAKTYKVPIGRRATALGEDEGTGDSTVPTAQPQHGQPGADLADILPSQQSSEGFGASQLFSQRTFRSGFE